MRVEPTGRVRGTAAAELVDATASAVEAGPLAGQRAGRTAVHPPRRFVELARCERGAPSGLRGHPLRRVVEAAHELLHLVHEQLRACRRGLARGVRDLVGDAAVDLVADARDHRDRHRRDRPSNELGVERREIGAGTAAAGDDHDVDVEAGQLAERPLDPAGRRGSLHPDVDHADLPREAAPLQLVDEVVVRRAPRRW